MNLVMVSKAVELYEKAAKRGSAAGQYDLALMYEKGIGVEKSPEKALYWYRIAAHNGYDSAQEKLAKLHG